MAGFYLIEQDGGARAGQEFIRDFRAIQDQLQGVEQALNVFGDVGSTNRAKTEFRAFNGAAQGNLNIPHFMVVHPVLGNTYLREAIDWMRAQKGAPAFSWVSVPSVSDWGTGSWKQGFNRRWINAMRQAIGNFQTVSAHRSYRRVRGVVGASGAITWTVGGNLNSLTTTSNVARFSQIAPSFLFRKRFEQTYSKNSNPKTQTIVDSGAIDDWYSTTYSGTIEAIEALGTLPQGSGDIEYEPFEEAYPTDVSYIALGEVDQPATTQQLVENDSDLSLWNQYAAAIQLTATVGVSPNFSQINESPALNEIAGNQSPTDSSVGSKIVSANSLPGTANGLLDPSSLDPNHKYFWAKPLSEPGLFDEVAPSTKSQYNAWRQLADEYTTEPQASTYVSKRGAAWADESLSASWATGLCRVTFAGSPASGNGYWVFWLRETLPLAEGWPTDEFTYSA